MLDYDGTLAPFERHRMLVTPYTGVMQLLWQLVAIPSVRLVVVTGREARELRQVLPSDLAVEIWGSHGRERLLVNNNYEVAPLNLEEGNALVWLEEALRKEGFGTSIEAKAGSLALHMRGQPPTRERELTELMPQLFRQIDGEVTLKWLAFDGGFEVRATGHSSATPVNTVIGEEEEGVVAAYLGDDLTDEDAYVALEDRGLSVLVKEHPRATVADLWLRPPDELITFLTCWLKHATPYS
jgi:trehalose-phosphatase